MTVEIVSSCLICVLINCDDINHVARITLHGTCCYSIDLSSSSLLPAIVSLGSQGASRSNFAQPETYFRDANLAKELTSLLHEAFESMKKFSLILSRSSFVSFCCPTKRSFTQKYRLSWSCNNIYYANVSPVPII